MVKTLRSNGLPGMLARPFGFPERELSQLMNQFFGNYAGGEAMWFAPLSIWEDDAGYHLQIDLPGVKQQDVQVTVEKDELRIAAERKPAEEERAYRHQERAFGKVERTITLPELVDRDSIQAEMREGVLTVHLVKLPEEQPKRIEIKVE